MELVSNNTGWEAALAIAEARDKNVETVFDLVEAGKISQAQKLVEEIRCHDKAMSGVDPRFDRGAGGKRSRFDPRAENREP